MYENAWDRNLHTPYSNKRFVPEVPDKATYTLLALHLAFRVRHLVYVDAQMSDIVSASAARRSLCVWYPFP
jgi:hypothetical protein